MFPNFSVALNLKKLFLIGCKNLRTIHECIGSLYKLVTLELRFCSNLEKLPSYLRLKSLISLDLFACKKLEQLPEFDENMASLREMKLDHTAIKELPPSVKHLTGLENLSLRSCKKLIALSNTIYLLKSLKELCLRGCSKLDMFPQRSSLNFPPESLCSKIITLDRENCNISNADFLETLSNVCTSLIELSLSGNKFSCLPSLHNVTSLRFLQLRNCKFLQNIPNLPRRLESVDASGCELLVISPANIADIILIKQDLEFGGSRELFLMNSEIPKYFQNQTTESLIRISIQHNPNKRQALVVCVVFKVDGDSCGEKAYIEYKVFINGMASKYFWKCFHSSKSEYMWEKRTPLTFSSSDVNDRHNINVLFWVNQVYSDAIVTIRSHGILVVDVEEHHAIQTVTDVREEQRNSWN